MSRNLREVYHRLKNQNNFQDESELRRRAWVEANRMMFESTLGVANSPSAGAGAGGSGNRRITSTSEQSILYYDFLDGVFYYFIYNFETAVFTDLKQISMNNSPSINPVTRGGFLLESFNSTNSNYDLYFINLKGDIIWQDTTFDDNSNNVDIENFSRYVAAYYLKDGSNWKLVVFDENSEIKSFDFENLIEGGGYSYDDVWNGGFVVRESVGTIQKFYIINFEEGTATLFNQVDTDLGESMSIYLYAYSNKILSIKNNTIYEVFDSNGQKISEFDVLSELATSSWSQQELSFIGDNGSFVLIGYDITNSLYASILFSGESNTFSFKTKSSSTYRQEIYTQKNYKYPEDWLPGGSAVIMFHDGETYENDISYYTNAVILPIWSTDTSLRDFYTFSSDRGIIDYGFAYTRSVDYINFMIDNDKINDTNLSVLRFNKVGEDITIIPTDLLKDVNFVSVERLKDKTILRVENSFTASGTWGWDDLSDVENRFYYSFKKANNGRVGNFVVGQEFVMKDVVNDQYWAIKFTEWGQNNGGSFAYTRQLIEGGTFSGEIIAFTHSNWLFSEPDVIVPGVLEIKRGDNGPIYNSAFEDVSNGENPYGTLWNSEYVYGTIQENTFYVCSLDGQIIDSVTTSNSYDSEGETSTFILEDEIFSKTWVSNDMNNKQFQLLPKYYTSFNDNNNTSEESGLRNSNFLLTSGFRSVIVTKDSISEEIITPEPGQISNKIGARDVFLNGAWVSTYDETNVYFYFYNVSGELISQKTFTGGLFNGYSSFDYGKRSSITYDFDGKKYVIVFDGTSVKEVETNYTNMSVSVNDYVWWSD